MKTRILETKRVIKNTVFDGTFLKKQDNSLFFKVRLVSQKMSPIEILNQAWDIAEALKEIRTPSDLMGSICIDMITDSILRIRYKEGEAVEENNTHMVVGTFKGPNKMEIIQKKNEYLVLTDKVKVVINLKPFRVLVFDLEERKLCGIGGF